MPVYTSLLESNNAQFHGGLSYKHAWLSDELGRQGSKVEVEELRLEPLKKDDKLDLVIEYAGREQAEAGSYFLRVPVDTAVVHSHSRFTECMNAVLDDINTNVRVLLPMTQTLRGMLGVKDTSITYDSKKAGERRAAAASSTGSWPSSCASTSRAARRAPSSRRRSKKAGIGPSHKDYRAMGMKRGPRAPIRKRR